MKNCLRRWLLFTLWLGIALAFAACSGKHDNRLVGKWKGTGQAQDAIITFSKDGQVSNLQGGRFDSGAYSLSASNTVIIKIGVSNTLEFGVSFNSPNEITLTPKSLNGQPVSGNGAGAAKFVRVPR